MIYHHYDRSLLLPVFTKKLKDTFNRALILTSYGMTQSKEYTQYIESCLMVSLQCIQSLMMRWCYITHILLLKVETHILLFKVKSQYLSSRQIRSIPLLPPSLSVLSHHNLRFTSYHIIISASHLIASSSLLHILSHHHLCFTSITSHLITSSLLCIISHHYFSFTSYHIISALHQSHHQESGIRPQESGIWPQESGYPRLRLAAVTTCGGKVDR